MKLVRGGGIHDTKQLILFYLSDDIEAMNHYLNEVIMATFSFFDTGSDCSETDEPERFYHGFILGLIVEQWENYRIRSNRESGWQTLLLYECR